MNRVYLDYASTTPVNPEVLKTYTDLLLNYFANSESLYDEGSEVNRMMEKARAAIAGLLGVQQEDIIFTSGASEANSMAIKGTCAAVPGKKHIITSQIEHSSVMNACRQMERLFGYDVTYLPVNERGVVSVKDVENALREDTVLVSIMHVNNEVGSVNPVQEIQDVVRRRSHACFHTDVTQSIGKTDVDLTHIDMASMSAHKIEGLKGSGLLIRKKHIPLEPLISGGEQEYGIRGGTSNACLNIVFAKTLRLALENHHKYGSQIYEMQNYLIGRLTEIEGIHLNSWPDNAGGIVNFSYEKIPSEVMQNGLNRAGFLVSARSTCESRSMNTSYVLKAMGYSDVISSSCIRVSLSRHTKKEELDRLIEAVKEMIQRYGSL